MFLAAIMVLSMVAVAGAFGAPAAAAVNSSSVDATDVTVGLDSTNQTVTANSSTDNATINVTATDAIDAGVSISNVSASSTGDDTIDSVAVNGDNITVQTSDGGDGTTNVSIEIEHDTSDAGTGTLTYSVSDGDTTESVEFNAVGATGATAEAIDVTASGDTAEVNVSHTAAEDSTEIAFVDAQGDRIVNFTSADDGTANGLDAVQAGNAGNTTFILNVTELNSNFDYSVGTGTIYAASESADDSFGSVNASAFQVEADFQVNGLEVTGFDFPRVAANDTTQTAEVTVENLGNEEVTQDVEFVTSNANSSLTTNAPENSVASEEVTVAAGGSETVNFEIDTGTLSGASDSATNYDVAGYTSGSPYSANTSGLLVGSGSEGSTSITVVDEQGNTLSGVNVELTLEDDRDTVIRSAQSNSQGRVTFNDLAVGSSDSNPIRYVAEVGANAGSDFESTTTTLELYEPTQTSDSSTVTLRSALEPEVIGVGAFDSDAQEIVGDSRTLFGDGNFDNQGEFAVFAQTQSANEANQPVNQDVEVDIAVVNGGADDPLRFVDPDNAGENATTITLTITPDSPTANVDGNDTTGVYSYETFSVTADNADDSTLDDPLTTEDFNVTTSDIGTRDVATDPDVTATSDSGVASGNGLQNSVTYVLEGEKQVTGDIRDSVSGADLSDVTLWAAYDGVENESLAFTSDTFVNAQGDSFLTAEATDNGNYVIDGIAGDNTNFTLYAVHDTNDRYNNINTSSGEVGFVAAANELQTTGSGTDDDTPLGQDLVLTEEQVELEYRLDVTVDGEPVDDDKFAEIPFDSQADVEVLVEERPEASNDPADWSAAANREVDIQLAALSGALQGTSTGQGELVSIDAETDEFGVATATFESSEAATGSAGSINVTALTENDQNTEFRAGDSAQTSEATIEVFGAGEITGDVVDEDNNNFGGPEENRATVQLFEVDASGNVVNPDNPLQETTTGPEGSYTFSDVRTGNDYRAVATFDGEDGFSTISDLPAGTTNADIVITGVEAPAGFDVTALDPADVNVTQGDVIDVTATIQNTAGQEDTQNVAFQVSNGSGTLVDVTQEVTIGAGETTEVTFEDIDTAALAPGDYTHGAYPADGTELTATLTVEEDNSSSNGPQLADYTNADGDTTTDLLRQAIDDWRNDEIGTDLLRNVIDNWRNS